MERIDEVISEAQEITLAQVGDIWIASVEDIEAEGDNEGEAIGNLVMKLMERYETISLNLMEEIT